MVRLTSPGLGGHHMPTDHNPDGWTFATLYTHIVMLSEAQKAAVAAAIAAATKAVDKAESAQQLRNDAQNEWRGAMSDQQARFADKVETNRRLGLLENANAAQTGKSAGVGMVGAIVIGAAVLLSTAIAAATFVYAVVHH